MTPTWVQTSHHFFPVSRWFLCSFTCQGPCTESDKLWVINTQTLMSLSYLSHIARFTKPDFLYSIISKDIIQRAVVNPLHAAPPNNHQVIIVPYSRTLHHIVFSIQFFLKMQMRLISATFQAILRKFIHLQPQDSGSLAFYSGKMPHSRLKKSCF